MGGCCGSEMSKFETEECSEIIVPIIEPPIQDNSLNYNENLYLRINSDIIDNTVEWFSERFGFPQIQFTNKYPDGLY
jgi:hypothetical protein